MGEYVNSKQVRIDRSYVSCGVMEAHHLPKQPANKTLFAIANSLYHKANPRPAAFIIFSDIIRTGNESKSRGQELALYLKENKNLQSCGTCFESTYEINPRTGNAICVWLFTPDHEKFREWYKEELANAFDGE